MYDIAIQIINYKTSKYLDFCLSSLLKDIDRTLLRIKINILDNHSGDDLSALEKKYGGNKRISFYYNNRNIGFGGGHNLLAKKTESHYLLFLNPDVEFIEPHTIQNLYETIQQASNIKIIGPQLVLENGSTQKWDHGELDGLIAFLYLQTGHSYWRLQKNISNVAWVSGAVFLIEKKIFEEVSGFDEHFFLYKEEEDLCWRIRVRGERIIYNPKIKVQHHGGAVAQKKDYLYQSTAYFLKKHFIRKIRYPFLVLLNKLLNS